MRRPDTRVADNIQLAANIIGAMRLAEDSTPTNATTPIYATAISKGASQASGPLCARCNVPVVGEWLSIAGKTYHPAHLLCDQCSAVIGVSDHCTPYSTCASAYNRVEVSCAITYPSPRPSSSLSRTGRSCAPSALLATRRSARTAASRSCRASAHRPWAYSSIVCLSAHCTSHVFQLSTLYALICALSRPPQSVCGF